MRYIADSTRHDAAADPLIALGDELNDLAAGIANGLPSGEAFDQAQRRLEGLTCTVLTAKAASLEGAAVQVRALSDFATYVGDARSEPGDEGLYLRALHSIAGALDRHLGIDRERWGGGFFLPSWRDPHA